MKLAAGIVRALIALLFIYYMAAFLWSVAGRVTYPYELDYFEGSTYLHTQRIIDGEGLYIDPDEGFIPYPYTPLYYYAVIPFTWISGQGVIAGRICTLAALAAIGWFIWSALLRETKSRYAGLFAFGMFLSLYYIMGAWFDVCRIDVFLCTMLMGSVYFLKDFPEKRAGLFPSALFLIAAIFTKQVGIVFLVFIFPFLYTRDKKTACIYFLGVLVLISAITGISNLVTGGWFWHYIYEVPQNRQFFFGRFVNLFLVEDVVGKIPILFIGSILWIFIRGRVAGKRTPLNVWEWTLPAALLASALPRSQPGGFENNLLPFALWCSIMFGFTFYHLPVFFQRLIGKADTSDAKRHWVMLRLIAYNFLLAQLILIFFIPTAKAFPRRTDYPIIPSANDKQAGDEFIGYIESFPGEVYLPVHNYYGWLAGKTPNLILASSIEHLEAGGAQPASFYEQLQEHHFDAIIANEPFTPRRIAMSYEKAILDDYYWAGNIQWGSRNVFLPVTGLQTRPDIVMLPMRILPGIEESISGRVIEFTRYGDLLNVFLGDQGNLHIVNPVEFNVEIVSLPFNNAALISATDDGNIALLVGNSVFLIGDGESYMSIPLPEMQSTPDAGQVAIDPLGRFIAVADYEGGSMYIVDIPSGNVLHRIKPGSYPRNVLISPDGSNLYLKTWVKFSLAAGGKGVATLHRFEIERTESSTKILPVNTAQHAPDPGQEMRLSPDGSLIFWFDSYKYDGMNVFDAHTLEFLYTMKGRGWRVMDIAFGDDPEKVIVHFVRSKFNGVALLDLKGETDYGIAKLYDRPGHIVPVPGTDDEVILFSRGTGRILRFKIYPNDSWPGEQGYMGLLKKLK